MKKNYYLFLLFYVLNINAQVGIGTTNPQATLDIREINPAAPTAQAGIAISQVSILPTTGNRAGQLLYLTTNNSYYFYNGSVWQPLLSGVSSVVGDVKNGYQTTDHNGWVLLDGRLKSTLTTTQQAVATTLGFATNLPNIADKNIVGKSATKALNSTGGLAAATITRDQLPNLYLSTLPGYGAHKHLTLFYRVTATSTAGGSFGASKLDLAAYLYPTTDPDGDHTHYTESLNGGVSQTEINIQNPYIAMNGFVYLGL